MPIEYSKAIQVRGQAIKSGKSYPLSLARARQYRRSSGVMIIPPVPGARDKINHEMKQVRANMIEHMGKEEYDHSIRESNEQFKALRGVRI